jgi:predicted ferric reductase
VILATSSKALWYLSRGSGIVTMLLLSAATALGLAGVARLTTRGMSRFVVQALHRNLALLSVVFLALHIATVELDTFVPLRWRDVIVPFIAAYKPFWVGLGALAFDLLAAVIITSLLRLRIGERAFRTVHWAAYAAWPVAIAHGIGNGSDRHERWFLVLTGLCILVVGSAAAVRWIWRVPDTPAVVRGQVVRATATTPAAAPRTPTANGARAWLR